MSQYTNYTSWWLFQKYEKRGDQDWIPAYPNVYSVDGEGSLTAVTKTENDPACGYVPTGETIYRWVNLNPNVDYYCEECPPDPSVKIYRWAKAPTTDYVCVGIDKHYKEYYQYSIDGGVTWQNVVPEQSRTSSDVIEYNSVDCGYIPTGETIYRWVKTNNTICVEQSKIEGLYYDLLGEFVTALTRPCDSTSAVTNCEISEEIIIPFPVNHGYLRQVNIGDCAKILSSFAFCTNRWLTGVTLGENVEIISGAAFTECTALKEIYLPDSVTTIGDGVSGYNDCCIGAFEDCTSLENIRLSDNLTYIGSNAFQDCTSLTSITIPNSVQEIGWGAFEGCTSLQSIVIPSGITTISNNVFERCNSLTSVTLSNSVTEIESYAFSGCSSLLSVTIPNTVTSIGDGAFESCNGFISVGENGSGSSVEIPSGVTSLYRTFYDCTGLTSVTIPDTITSLGEATFDGCVSLQNVTLGDGITSVGSQTFRGCISLEEIDIPSGVTGIGSIAFKDCENLRSVTVRATTPPSLSQDAFEDTPDDLTVYVPENSFASYAADWQWGKLVLRPIQE